MSPLTAAFSIAFIYLGIVAALFILIQLMKHFSVIHLFLYLYFANLIMISVRLIRFHIQEHIRIANERETEFRSKSGRFFHKIMTKTSSMNLFCFILTLPITAVFEIIYIICGQGPDGFIKAFTMTADWTFSTQIPPPPIDYEGHYLCTVAAGGHKEIVKPLRYGKRQNAVIVVNRQLLVANAFEDLIQEKLPRAHRVIRGFYDKHGYPVSRFITTRSRADAVYIMMKPLEFIFILTLYLFDRHPENRIAVQYSEYKESL